METTRPIIAILRGLDLKNAGATAEALAEAGIGRIEAPLNQPNALEMISEMTRAVGGRAEIGAGTVLSEDDVDAVAAAGGRFVVAPNVDAAVISRAKARGLSAWPGAFTATECFAALKAGADGLKLFPAFMLGPEGVDALRLVMPGGTPLYAVGGVGPERFADYLKAGATGFGLGSCIFKPGWTPERAGAAAREVVSVFDAVARSQPG